jgi:hypothetical protein
MVVCALCGSKIKNSNKRHVSIDVISYVDKFKENVDHYFDYDCYIEILNSVNSDNSIYKMKVNSSRKYEFYKIKNNEIENNNQIYQVNIQKSSFKYGIFELNNLKKFIEKIYSCPKCRSNRFNLKEVSYSGVLKFYLTCCHCKNKTVYEPPTIETKKKSKKKKFKQTEDVIKGALASGINYSKFQEFSKNLNILLPNKNMFFENSSTFYDKIYDFSKKNVKFYKNFSCLSVVKKNLGDLFHFMPLDISCLIYSYIKNGNFF